MADVGVIVEQSTVDDLLLLSLAIAAAVVFAASLVRSRTFGEVTWVVHMTRKTGPPEVIRVMVEMSNAGSAAACDFSVWTRPHMTGPQLEVALSSVRAGQYLAVELDVPKEKWDDMWLEIHWRARGGRGWPLTTSYHLATRTPPCDRAASSF